MKPEFTAAGVSVQTFQEIYDELSAGYRDIYGEDINLDPDSPDGQRLAIEAQARLDLQSFCLMLYQQIDPDFAFGQRLRSTIKLAGILPRAASRSQADVTIITDRVLTLPVDYTVEDDLGQNWTTLAEIITVAGSNSVTLFAENFGSIEADAGTITDPITFVKGVISVTNPLAASAGQDEETDQEIRLRRNRSLENPATSTVGGIFSALGNIPGVTDLIVYENDQPTTDIIRDIPPNTLWIVIEGGSIAEITEVMAKNKTGGTGLKGSVVSIFLETLKRPNGDDFQILHEMKFDRPTEVPLYINLTATRKVATDPIDTDLIKQILASRKFSISENAIASELYTTVYEAGTNFVATLLQVSDDNITFVDTKIDALSDEKFTIDIANIVVTEVV